MIGVFVAMVAMLSHAASYSWSAVGSVYWAGSESFDDFDGYSIYAFDATAYSMTSITSALGGGNLEALENALGSGTVNGFEFSFSGTGLSDNGAESPVASTYFIMLGIQGDEKYFTSYTVGDIEVTDAVVTGGAVLSTGDGWVVDNQIGGNGWTAIATSAVPEPTSGLLLLLGVAGLALKRKCA